MNQRKRFIRKIVYACAIAALLLPLSWLSQPETALSEGGVLAQMRKEHQLSQAALGDIDPASETIKLATLGMRGVAANLLWEKANYYKKVEDWSSLSATLEQIARLQPNFVSVWIYQGWNLTYNISVEFDDYHDRYYWVIKGIDFLKEGTTYNKKEPRLLSEIGWTIAQKIGRADEHLQFRKLFREDDDFNGSTPRTQRDNWLVGREWLMKAEDLAAQGYPVKGKSPLLFHSHPAMCLINYSEALEEEGTFGEVAKNAWKKAAEVWTEFSHRDLPTQYNVAMRLSDKELYDERAKTARAELEKLTSAGLAETIFNEKVARLPQADRENITLAPEQRSQEQRNLLPGIRDNVAVTPLDIADRITGDNHGEALRWAEEVAQAEFMARAIDSDRGIVNYDYWTLRCQLEPSDDTLAARKLFYDADQEFLAADLVKSAELYEQGLKKWRVVLDAYPQLLADANLTDELIDSIKHYRSVLHQLDKKFPTPFLLHDVLEANARFSGVKLPTADAAAEPNQPAAPQAKPEPGGE